MLHENICLTSKLKLNYQSVEMVKTARMDSNNTVSTVENMCAALMHLFAG